MSAVHPKVQAAGAAGAVSVVVVWVLSASGVVVPADVAAALPTLIAVLAGYIKGVTS